MKRLFLLFLIISFYTPSSFCQIGTVAKKNTPTDSVLTTNDVGKMVLTDISQGNVLVNNSLKGLYAYGGNRPIIFITDSLRGGIFYRYTGSMPVDNGMIFSDTLNRKWMRLAQGDKINVQWYGARPEGYNNQSDNNYNAIMKAIQFVQNSGDQKTVLIPANKSNSQQSFYYISKTINIHDNISIEGEGNTDNSGGGLYSKLLFPKNTLCFFIGNKTGGGANTVEIKGLSVEQATPTGTDKAAHAFDIRCNVKMQNVYVRYISGNGINIDACANSSKDPNFGNADKSRFDNVNTYECNNGFYINGCDANAITFNDISAVYSKRWGIWDNSLLGNTFNSPHLSANGGNNCVVISEGKYYACVADNGSKGEQPGKGQNQSWVEVPAGATSGAWDPARTYYSGGAYYVSGASAFSSFNSPYTESFQAPARLNQRSMTINGDQGVNVYNGLWLQEQSSQFWIRNSDMILPSPSQKIGIGTGTPHAPLHIKFGNGESQAAAIFETSLPFSALSLQNSNGSTQLRATGDQFVVYSGFYPITVTNKTEFSPAVTENFDLGTSLLKWKNVYAKNYIGNWQGNAIATTYGGTGLSDYAPYALLAGGITAKAGLQQISGAGTAGQVLMSNGPGALPSWQTVNPAQPDVSNTNKGYLSSRMTTAQRDAIAKPVEGVMIYNTTTHKLNFFNGSAWEQVTSK
ncbi:hypothetical protein [Ferruginibacter sp. SUN106]|uniref:hypothetical protein n=1 Tax=Ferruginibacter sp. SUN106 TaxID=2978348 RepID=UPI003D35FF07